MRVRRRLDREFICFACGKFGFGRIEFLFDNGMPAIRFCDTDLRTLHHLLEDAAPEETRGGSWR